MFIKILKPCFDHTVIFNTHKESTKIYIVHVLKIGIHRPSMIYWISQYKRSRYKGVAVYLEKFYEAVRSKPVIHVSGFKKLLGKPSSPRRHLDRHQYTDMQNNCCPAQKGLSN
jgi:hypothetical protein